MGSYGIITTADGLALERSLRRVAYVFAGERLRILEVGVCHGDTARGIKAFLDGNGVPFDYVGVDNGRDLPVQVPFPGAKLVLGQSEEVYPQIESGLHWIFCDGCHALNAVMLDFLNYGDRLLVGGEIVFHDTSPLAQGKCDYQGQGPRLEDGRAAHPDFGTASREALRKLGLLDGKRTDWKQVDDTWLPDVDWGGTITCERTA